MTSIWTTEKKYMHLYLIYTSRTSKTSETTCLNMSTLKRRLIVFFESLTIISLDKRRADSESQDSLRLSSSKISRISDFLSDQKRSRSSAVLSLKVNSNFNQFFTDFRFSAKSTDSLWKTEISWQEYKVILKDEQVDSVIVANKKEILHLIVVVKEHTSTSNENRSSLKFCAHDNIVELQRAFFHDNIIFLICEWMNLSLAEFQSSHTFVSYQIAAIFKKIDSTSLKRSQTLNEIIWLRYWTIFDTFTKSFKLRMKLLIWTT